MTEPTDQDDDELEDEEDENDLDDEDEGDEDDQQELIGECPFCGTTGNIAGSDWCEHWIGIDDIFKSSDPICPLTEGEPFDTFLGLIDLLEDLPDAQKERIINSRRKKSLNCCLRPWRRERAS